MLAVVPQLWKPATVSYSTEAAAFFARLATQPTTTRKNQYAALIDALVSAGVWSLLDALYLYAAYDEATALTNLKSSSFGGTNTNSVSYTADQGYTGASSKYIDLGYNPTTAGGNFAQNSACRGGWSLTSGQLSGAMCG